jgi:O-antigen/teichoic acid export membrane protein
MHLKPIAYTFLSKITVALLGLALVVFVSRTFGSTGRGHISLFLSSVALLQMLMEFGSNSAVINLSYTHSPKMLLKSAALFISVIFILALPVFGFLDLPFKWAITPMAVLFALVNLLQMLLMGQQQLVYRNISLLVAPILVLLGLLISVYNLGPQLNLYPLCLAISLLISAIIAFSWFYRFLPKQSNEPFVFQSIILQQGAWVQGAQLIQFLNYRINFFLIALWLSDADLGVYNNVIVICEAVWILGHSMGQIQHMKIRNSVSALVDVQMTKRYVGLNLLGAMAMALVLCLLPSAFWTSLFSQDFKAIAQLLPHCVLGILVFSVSNIINHYLHAKDQFKVIFWINVFGLCFGLLAAIVAIPSYGLIGACWSWGVGLTASMVGYLYYFVKHAKNA